jgi:hypothetical protein
MYDNIKAEEAISLSLWFDIRYRLITLEELMILILHILSLQTFRIISPFTFFDSIRRKENAKLPNVWAELGRVRENVLCSMTRAVHFLVHIKEYYHRPSVQ